VAAVKAEKGIVESVSRAIGLAGGIVLKGKRTVLIKPNAVFGLRPSTGTVTNPLVVDGVIKYLIGKGIKSDNITVGECSAMGYDTKKAFRISGLQDICNKYGVRTSVFDDGYATRTFMFDGRKLEIEVAKEVFENDIIINVPVIKTHFQAGASMALKNMFGVVSWESRKTLHKIGLVNGIAYLNSVLPKYFTVGDATIGLHGKGPTLLGKPGNWNLIFASGDPVAHDVMVCSIFGLKIPDHVNKATQLHVGTDDTKRISLAGDALQKMKIEPATPDVSPLRNVRIVDGDACSYCMNYVWTVLYRLSKEDAGKGKHADVLIGKLLDKCKLDAKTTRIVCGDCASMHAESGNFVPGCPPKMSEIEKMIRRVLKD